MVLPVNNEQGIGYLAPSIPAGHISASDDFAKALLAVIQVNPHSKRPFSTTQEISLQAIMPWLNRVLPYFDLKKCITIQYPIELREFDSLKSVPQGSRLTVSWKVSSGRLNEVDCC